VAGLLAPILLIGVPTIAWLLALFSLRTARRAPPPEGPAEAAREHSTERILVYALNSGAPIAFGIIVYVLAKPVLDVIDGLGAGTNVRLEPVLLWATFAFSVASCSAIAAQTWIVRRRLREFLGPGFGRVFILSAVPTTAIVFALVSMLLLLGNVNSTLGGGPAPSDSALAGAISRSARFSARSPNPGGWRTSCLGWIGPGFPCASRSLSIRIQKILQRFCRRRAGL